MRILAVAEDLRGPMDEGMKKTAWETTSALAARHDVLCLTSEAPAEDRDYIHRIRLNKAFLNVGLYTEIQRFGPDCVLYFPEASVTRNSFIRALALRFCSSSFTAVTALQPREYGTVFRALLPYIMPDLVLVSSKSFARELAGLGLHTEVLPPGVDTDRFVPVDIRRKGEIRESLGLPKDKRIVIHVGHIKENRNLSDLEAFAATEGFFPVIVGSTSTIVEKNVEQRLIEKGIRVVSSHVERIEEYYQAADLYVFPVVEPKAAINFPLSVIEAASCGIPVLARPFGALIEEFPCDFGFDYYATESELLGKAETLCRQDPDLVADIQRNRVCAFSWGNIADRLTGILLSHVKEG